MSQIGSLGDFSAEKLTNIAIEHEVQGNSFTYTDAK